MPDTSTTTNFRAHALQTAVILLPTIGAIVALYVLIRTDLNRALDDNARQDKEMIDMRRDEKEFANETRRAWNDVRDVLTKIQVDAATSAALARKQR